jgi:hypothetical protein
MVRIQCSSHRRQLLTKFSGGPEINLSLTKFATKSENVLGAPYPPKFFPDKTPVIIKFMDGATPQNEKFVGMLTSLDVSQKKFVVKLNQTFQQSMNMSDL